MTTDASRGSCADGAATLVLWWQVPGATAVRGGGADDVGSLRFLELAFLAPTREFFEIPIFGALILPLVHDLLALAEATWPRVTSLSSSSDDALVGETSLELLTCYGGGVGGSTSCFGFGIATALNACSRLSSLDILLDTIYTRLVLDTRHLQKKCALTPQNE